MPTLFSPFTLKSITFLNRVVMPPMVTGKAAADGAVADAIFEHYGPRAARAARRRPVRRSPGAGEGRRTCPA